MIELPRSTFYYRAMVNTTGLADDQVVELIQTIRDELPIVKAQRDRHEDEDWAQVLQEKPRGPCSKSSMSLG